MKVALHALCLLTIAWCPATGHGQDLSDELARVRSAFGPTYRFEVDRQDRLVIDLLRDGRPARQDVVYLEFLDTAGVRWSEAERSVELSCLDARGQCIDKEIYHLGTVRHTGRSALPLPEGRAADEAVEALRELIVAGRDRVRAHDLETHRRPSRKR